MFIVSLTYKVPLSLVDQHLEAHVTYLKEQYAAGHFLASGKKVPRTGGMILARAADRNSIDEILKQDPFYQHQLADYQITEFVPGMAVEQLQFLLE